MNIGIGSGDGNSIFEIAAKYEKMQIREMRNNIETIKQGLRNGTDTGSITTTTSRDIKYKNRRIQ